MVNSIKILLTGMNFGLVAARILMDMKTLWLSIQVVIGTSEQTTLLLNSGLSLKILGVLIRVYYCRCYLIVLLNKAYGGMIIESIIGQPLLEDIMRMTSLTPILIRQKGLVNSWSTVGIIWYSQEVEMIGLYM